MREKTFMEVLFNTYLIKKNMNISSYYLFFFSYYIFYVSIWWYLNPVTSTTGNNVQTLFCTWALFFFLLESILIAISLSVYYLSRDRQNKRILEWKKIWTLSLALATSLIRRFPLPRTFLPPQTHWVNSHASLRPQPACHFLRNHPWSSNLKQVLLILSQGLHFSFRSGIMSYSCSSV